MTSLMVVLKNRGAFMGTLGADFALDSLQAELADQRPFGVGRFALISTQGAYVAHPDAQKVGQAASDLGAEALQAISAGVAHTAVDERGVARIFQPISTGCATTPWSLMLTFKVADALGVVAPA